MVTVLLLYMECYKKMARSDWYVLIIPSVSVFMDGQTETDFNKIKQMVDKHLHMKIQAVIDFF